MQRHGRIHHNATSWGKNTPAEVDWIRKGKKGTFLVLLQMARSDQNMMSFQKLLTVSQYHMRFQMYIRSILDCNEIVY